MKVDAKITLYYRDRGEYAALCNLKDEFAKRGFKTQFSDDLKCPSEIGIYACSANSFYNFESGEWDVPQNILSVFVVHDLNQHNGSEYKHFLNDPLKVFDLALFPSDIWIDWLEESATFADTRPRIASVVVGYPKSDHTLNRGDVFNQKVLEPEKKSQTVKILIAASWQSRHIVNDLKELVSDHRFQVSFKSPEWEDDFDSKVFGPWKEVLTAQRIESKYVEDLVKRDSRFVSLPNDIDIFSVIRDADVIVSNGSNVLFEGLICGKPGINITNWLHPIGEHGELTSKPNVDFPGILSGSSQDLSKLIDLALADEIGPLIRVAKTRLVSPQTTGKASWISAEVIIDTYEKLVNGVLPHDSYGHIQGPKVKAKSELELTQLEILQKYRQDLQISNSNQPHSAIAERDSAIAERDSAIAERDSVLSSGIWSATKPYRWLRNKF